MQIVSVLARTFSGSVQMPGSYVSHSQGMNFVNLDLAYAMPYASCSLSISYTQRLILHLITPIAFLVSVTAAQFMATLIGKSEKTILRIFS